MNEKQFKRVMVHLAEEQVPADADLWPAIRARLETSKAQTPKGDFSMNAKTNHRRGLRLAATIALALLAGVGLLLATPQGRVWAQGVLQFFTRAESDTLPVQAWQLTPIPTAETTPTPDPASILDASQTVAAVEQQAGFDVLEPTWLPPVLSFAGASLEPDHPIARIFYRLEDTNGLVLREQPFARTEDCQLCGEVGASAAVETVKIGDATGEYAEGVWSLTDSGPVWQNDPYLKTLRWQLGDMALELQFMGPPDAVTKEDLIAVAESLK